MNEFDTKKSADDNLLLIHDYCDLPSNGLGKSMDCVGLNEPVIIPQYAVIDDVTWPLTVEKIGRRAYELHAEVFWMVLPPQNTSDCLKFKMWFSQKPGATI